MKNIILAAFLIVILSASYAGAVQEDKELYSRAIASVKEGQLESAFVSFHTLLSSYPESDYADRALFATAEYYFTVSNYREAASSFIRYIETYPDSRARIFALMYLYKIAQGDTEESLSDNLKKQIVDFKQLIFLFKKSKEYRYRSPLRRNHKVVYYIDKVEFYVNGDLFEKILY